MRFCFMVASLKILTENPTKNPYLFWMSCIIRLILYRLVKNFQKKSNFFHFRLRVKSKLLVIRVYYM